MYRTRATCFFCGKSKLVNSPTPILRYYKCSNCEAENHFDEKGEIEDFAPDTPPQKENIRYGFRASPKERHTSTDEAPVCCENCLRNQALIVKNLAEYLPDESHPDYDNYVANMDNYRRQTEERYPPLCPDCAPKVQAKIRQMNYMAKSASLGKLLENSNQMLKSRALHSRVVWGPGLWIKSLLWTAWGSVYLGSILLLMFWHLCGAMYPMFLESAGGLSLETWKVCLRQSKENMTLGSACYAASTDWVKYLFPWVLITLPWNYKWLSIKRNPGAYAINLQDYFKCQAIFGIILLLDWLISGRVRDEKSLEKFNVIFLVLEILIFWTSMTSVRVSYPTKITFKEKPVVVAQKNQELPRMKPLDLPASPTRHAQPVTRSFAGFVPGKSTNVQTRSQSSRPNTAATDSSLSFDSSFRQSFNELGPSPFQSTSTSQTSVQPEMSFWGSQQQPSYNTATQSTYDPDAMEVDSEPPASQMSQMSQTYQYGLSGPSFQEHRFAASTTPSGTPAKRPIHHRSYSNSSDEGNDNNTPIKSRKLLTNSESHSYGPVPAGKLNSNLFADKTGLEGLFEAAARLEDPIPAMSTKAVVKIFINFIVGIVRLVVLCLSITLQLEYVGWPSMLSMCAAVAVGPFWRILDYYIHAGNRPIKQLLKRHRRLLISCLEVLFAVILTLFKLSMMAWTKLHPDLPPADMSVVDEPIFTPITDVFNLSTITHALNPTTISTAASSSALPSASSPQFLATQATINMLVTKLFFLSLILHQTFELVATLFHRYIPSANASSSNDAGFTHKRRSSRDYGISHAVAQPLPKRSPSPLSSFKLSGGTPPRRPESPPLFGGLNLGRPSNAVVVRNSSEARSSDNTAAPLYRRQPAAQPYFGMSTAGVRVPPTGSSIGEGMTLRERGLAANKKPKTKNIW